MGHVEEIDWSDRKNADAARMLDYITDWKLLTPIEQNSYGGFGGYIRVREGGAQIKLD